jgi:hypothetical protein
VAGHGIILPYLAELFYSISILSSGDMPRQLRYIQRENTNNSGNAICSTHKEAHDDSDSNGI